MDLGRCAYRNLEVDVEIDGRISEPFDRVFECMGLSSRDIRIRLVDFVGGGSS